MEFQNFSSLQFMFVTLNTSTITTTFQNFSSLQFIKKLCFSSTCILDFKTFQVYSSYLHNGTTIFSWNISKLFKFTVHNKWKDMLDSSKGISKLFKFTVHNFNFDLYWSKNRISKLFKFTVHIEEQKKEADKQAFQNFSSLQFIFSYFFIIYPKSTDFKTFQVYSS